MTGRHLIPGFLPAGSPGGGRPQGRPPPTTTTTAAGQVRHGRYGMCPGSSCSRMRWRVGQRAKAAKSLECSPGCHLFASIAPCKGIVESTVPRETTANGVEAVYRQDGARLWRALYGFAGDADVASEAMAEAFAQALRRGPAVRDVSRWVWRSAFRLAAADLKNRSQLVHGSLPDGAVYDSRLDDEVLHALQSLTPKQRIVIVLHYYVDCPVREVGRRTGMNVLAVRSHLSRGRKRLRELLGSIDV